MTAERVPFWKEAAAQLRKEWWYLLVYLGASAGIDYFRFHNLMRVGWAALGLGLWIFFCLAGVVFRRQADAAAQSKADTKS